MSFVTRDVSELTQWDQGRILECHAMTDGDRVFFRGASGETYTMRVIHTGVEVPNVLLQTAKPIVVDLEGHPECRTQIRVNPAEKPANYMFIDNVMDSESRFVKVFSDCIESSVDTSVGLYVVGAYIDCGFKSTPKIISITYDGVAYNNLSITPMDNPGMGSFNLCGNLSLMNTILGTSLEDTGEPFLCIVTADEVDGFVTLLVPDVEATMHTVAVYVPLENIKEADRDHLPEFADIDLVELGVPVLSEDNPTAYVAISETTSDKIWNTLKQGAVSVRFKVHYNFAMLNTNGVAMCAFGDNTIFTGVGQCSIMHNATIGNWAFIELQFFGVTFYFAFTSDYADDGCGLYAKAIGNGTI